MPDARTVPWLVARATVCARCPRSLLAPRALAMRLLGGFAGGFGLEGRGASAFPQVDDICSEPRLQQTAQKPRLMSTSEPIFCKTVQKSWGAGIGHRTVAVEADFRAPVCAMEGCTLPGVSFSVFSFGKAILPDHAELAGFPWLRGRFGRSAAIPIIPAAPGAPSLIRLLPVLRKRGQYKTAIVERNGVVWHLRIEAVPLLRCCCCASAVPVGSRHKSHVMRRWTRGWDAYSTERSPAQLNAKVALEPPFGAATLPIMNRRSCIGAARKGCSCVFSNPGWD